MKRSFPRLLPLALIALAVLLAACSGAPVKSVYSAAGDGTTPADLVKTTTFNTDDDLNLVVKLNSHNHTLNVAAIFTAPNGSVFATDALEADETVGEVVLGLDWEGQGSTPWETGEWKAVVTVDDKTEKTVTFTVNATSSVPAAG